MSDQPTIDFASLKRLAHERFERELARNQARLHQELQAIEVLEALAAQGRPADNHGWYEPPTDEPTLAEAVRQIMSAFRGHFRIDKVRHILEERFPTLASATSASVLSNTVNRVARSESKVHVVNAGRGRRSTVYYNDQERKPDAEASGE